MGKEHASNAPHAGQAATLWAELCECRRQLDQARKEKEMSVGYPQDLDEMPDYRLTEELARRNAERQKGNCPYCGQPKTTYPACRFPQYHADLHAFWALLSQWSQATFGKDEGRGPSGPLKHLVKEVQEALADPKNPEEYADLLFLVFDAARRSGLNYYQMLEEVFKKLEKNKARQWGPPSATEPVEHVRAEVK